MAIASTILDLAQRTLGFDRSDIGIPGLEEDQLLAVCGQAVIEYHERFKGGGGEPSSILQRESGAVLTADTTTAEAITSATTDFDVTDSADFPVSGVLAVWEDDQPDYIAFTGNAADNFTGVTGIGYSHASGVTVSRLYPLPSDFSDFRSSPESPYGVTVDGNAFVHTSGTPMAGQFHLYDNGTTKYLSFAQGVTGNMAVRYNANPTTVDAAGDSVDVPEKDQWFVVWRIVQYAAPILGKMEQYQIATDRAERIMTHALITRNIGKRPKVRPMRSFIITR